MARELAGVLSWRFLDTGAIYRAAAALALERRIALGDGERLRELVRGMDLRMVLASGGSRVFSGERELTELLRTEEV